MKNLCGVIVVLSLVGCAHANRGMPVTESWNQLRGDATGTGNSPSVGQAFAPSEQGIEKALTRLLANSPITQLKAGTYLKRSGAAAVPALQAEIEKQGPDAAQAKQILDSIAEPEILWKFNAESFFTGSPVFDEKAVYAADRGGNLYAINKYTGEKLWQTKLTKRTNCTPLLVGDSLYIGTHDDGTMSKVRKSDGEILWTFTRDDIAEGKLGFVWDGASADGENIYFATADGKVFALRQSDGEKVWEFSIDPADAETELPGIFYGIPARSGGKLYIGGSNGKVYCIDATDGSEVWKFDAPEPIVRSLAVAKGLVFAGGGKDLIAIDAKTGEQKWSFKTMRKITSAPTAYGDHVVICGRYGMTHAVKADTGELYWTGKLAGEVTGSLAIVNDRIYFNTTTMNVGCANFNSIGEIWNRHLLDTFSTKAPSPAVDNGIVYITTPMTSRPKRRPHELEVSNCIIAILGTSDNLYGLNPYKPYYGLDEVHRRVIARSNKPYPLLLDADGVMQSEQLIFHDPRTGSEITKFTDDAAANPHSIFINRPAYNVNGSKLIFRSNRAGGPGRYVVNADGTRLQWVKVDNPILNYRIGPIWDRKEPNITYTNTNDVLYKLDVETFELTKLCDLPDPKRSKSIWSYPSADNSLLMFYSKEKAYLARTDGSGVKTLELGNKPNVMELSPKHDKKWEKYGVHESLFIKNAANTFMFNYGPSASVGEGIFFEMDTDGNLVRKIYPYADPEDGKRVYYSHTGWSHDGSKVAYYGYGGPRVGHGLIMRDADGSNPVLLCDTGGGGHTGWNNYDNTWVFASTSRGRSKYAGTILRCKTDGSQTAHILCDARTKTKINNAYSAIPRVSPSPDGTKAIFSNAMLGTSVYHDTYSVAAKRPDPPVNIKLDGDILTWDPPRLNREIKGYNVYHSLDGRQWKLLTPKCVEVTSFKTPGDGQYVVTSLEWSQQESLAPSATVVVGEVKPTIMLEAEFSEYSMPLRELRDMKAANWHAVENTAQAETTITLEFDCPTAGDYYVYLRIRGGQWRVAANSVELAWLEAQDKWLWAKPNKAVELRVGKNTLSLTSINTLDPALRLTTKSPAVDKIIITPIKDLRPEGPMYIDTTAPTLADELTAERLDNVNVKLNWQGAADVDLRYYNVYYSSTDTPELKQANLIASPPAGDTQYIDFATEPGADAYYAVTAVDRFANESKPITAAAPANK